MLVEAYAPMSRLKKPIDYVNHLRFSSEAETQALGENLYRQYIQWTKSLRLNDLLPFIQTVKDNKDRIGAAQLFGKFRSYALEEFIYRMIKVRVRLSKALDAYWGERSLIWRGNGQEYGMEQDVLIGRKLNGLIQPVVAVDSKVELDASRLKEALASFFLLKRWNPHVKCFLVYIMREVDPILMGLTGSWIDGIYQFSTEKDETVAFIKSVQDAVELFQA